MERLQRYVSVSLIATALLMLLALAGAWWWADDPVSRIRRISHGPVYVLRLLEVTSLHGKPAQEQRRLARVIAQLLPQWCPRQCSDWVVDANDRQILMLMLIFAGQHEPGLRDRALELSRPLLRDPEVFPSAFAVWGRIGGEKAYPELKAMVLLDPEMREARDAALEAILHRLGPAAVMRLSTGGRSWR